MARGALNKVDRALCAYAEKLTRAPSDMGERDVERLRAEGLDDVAIHDATQIIGFFNYINRVADALGCRAGALCPPLGRKLVRRNLLHFSPEYHCRLISDAYAVP